MYLPSCVNTCEYLAPPAGHHVHLQMTVQAKSGPFGCVEDGSEC